MASRRDFLKSSALFGMGLAGLGTLPDRRIYTGEPLYKLSLAEWSLHRALFGGDLDHLDFAPTAREQFGIDTAEYVNQFFMDKAKDQSYLREMKKRAEGAGVRSRLIMCDNEGHLGAPDEKDRLQAVKNHKKWVEAAQFLGCSSIRVNASSAGNRAEQLQRSADGLRRLCEFADDYDINVIVENHGGLSSDGAWLANVMERVDHPRCGTLPDFGNFEIDEEHTYNRYKGVREMMPYAKAVSAKTYGFDDDGNAKVTDYQRMMQIVLNAGYHGYMGIEYEGDGMSEPEGIRATQALLLRVRRELARAAKSNDSK